ncbi:MAG: penicillin-binding transpeptidase domain-containing protein [Longimicrobiales bacterium]|nr:penicillin-binding transpeptidase domain-containing protein [Longimicrobiales bacterium]
MRPGSGSRCVDLPRFDCRRRILLGAWLLAALTLLARAVEVQVVESSEWRERARMQQQMASAVPAPRGTIYDRDGTPLAVSRERYEVSIDADQLQDRVAVRAALVNLLGFTPRRAGELTDPARDWIVVPGRFEPSVRPGLEGLQGVHLRRELRRDYPYETLMAGILGRVVEERGAGGIEQNFEELLTGHPGRSVVARDSHGRPIPGQTVQVEAPRAGGDVHLTIDLDLQEIGHQALTEAITETGARGGDLIVTDPRTGEILAMVSIDGESAGTLSGINTPYEPGSTLKPFTVAALLESGKARLVDEIEIGDGRWTVNGRTLTDDHADTTRLSLADALRVSSNVGVAKAALVLTPGEQYEALRDFGFGVRTGVPLPGESAGILRRPREWSQPSPQSLAIGYEISVTPLQMAMAYGALANGGRLLEARLVSRVRAPDAPARHFPPQVIRKVVHGGVTGQISRVLVDVVDDGTGVEAQLGTISVAGKTGTSRVYGDGGYQKGRYFSSFVGYFPAEAPQLVIFVKLDSPTRGLYYGGATAAPVTRATMEAALAARQSPLDRGELLRLARRAPFVPRDRATETEPVRFAALDVTGGEAGPLSTPGDPVWVGPGEASVPDVSGLPLRVAVRHLHRLGFRVRVDDGGGGFTTDPEPGRRWAVGDTVRIVRTDR